MGGGVHWRDQKTSDLLIQEIFPKCVNENLEFHKIENLVNSSNVIVFISCAAGFIIAEYDCFAGDIAKKGAEFVVEKIQGAGADGDAGADGEAGADGDQEKDKGGLLSGILGGSNEKKEEGE